MELWRLCRAKHEATAFSGHGAELAGGRWNHKGHPMVYASEHLSLAILEMFVHVSAQTAPGDLISIRASLPDAVPVTELPESALPPNWKAIPAPAEMKDIGTAWLKQGRTAVLVVPSAVSPRERNLLLNPKHPAMNFLQADSGQPFHFDPRMFEK